ncbi:MAG: 50S ribosomal protein L11 methyltransferase [Lachnospiraceae bacterium]|nr:50S ribosomal protein L11 methyltransferase [Lachnospiraceae bacterium]
MKWRKLTLNTTTEALDYLGAIAMDLGLEGFEIEDNVPLSEEDKKRMFIDILPTLPPDDGSARVSFYVSEDTDTDKLLGDIKREADDYSELCDFGKMTFDVGLTDDRDYINNWKKYFKSFRVNERLVIKPTWEKETPLITEGDTVIEIDPGTAFGTGAHETTKLCLIAMSKYLKKGELFMDMGCGSGILSIAAVLFGAGKAFGFDVDDNASRISIENAGINKIPAEYEKDFDGCDIEGIKDGSILFATGNLLDSKDIPHALEDKKFDFIAANILADIIIPLAPYARKLIKDGGIITCSGILTTKEESVVKALRESGFEIIETEHMGEWSGVTARASV